MTVWEIIAAVITAVSTLALAVIAGVTAKSWHTALRYNRIDECISASRDVRHAVNRCLALCERGTDGQKWAAYDQVWESWRRLDKAVAILRRYPPSQPNAQAVEEIPNVLFRLRDICESWPLKAGEAKDAVVVEIKKFTEDIEKTADIERMLAIELPPIEERCPPEA
jgi:hypothetical protein